MKKFTVIFMVSICAVGSSAMAQVIRDEVIFDTVRTPAFGEETRESAELATRLNFCRQLMRSRNFEDAAAMLEQLYEHQPENPSIVGLLVQCYDQLQQYEKSEMIIERHLTRNPENFNFRLLYAEARFWQNRAIGSDPGRLIWERLRRFLSATPYVIRRLYRVWLRMTWATTPWL